MTAVAAWSAAAGVVLAAALRLRWLTAGGAAAAALVGAALVAGLGARGVALLLVFFVSASALTRAGRRAGPRARRLPDRDTAGRTGGQVLANGGVAALCALGGLAGLDAPAQVAAAGALAAATADTWASEVGMCAGRETRLVTTWERVAPGRSGGVSLPGSAAGVLGAALLAGAAGLAYERPSLAAGVALGGVAGMLLDSWLGAALEGRVAWIRNDTVNWAATAAGAVVAALAAA